MKFSPKDIIKKIKKMFTRFVQSANVPRMTLMRGFSTVQAGSKIPSAVVSVVSHNGESFQNDIVDIAEYL